MKTQPPRLDEVGCDADVHAYMLEEWADPSSRHYRDPGVVESALDYQSQLVNALTTITTALSPGMTPEKEKAAAHQYRLRQAWEMLRSMCDFEELPDGSFRLSHCGNGGVEVQS